MVILNKNHIIFNNKALIIILYIQIVFVKCDDYIIDLSCLYPKSFDLYNGNIIICCNDGIYTYNSNFKTKLYFKEFQNEILLADAEFVTINQYPNNGNAIVITKNEFYFLSPEGKVIFNENLTLDSYGSFYILIPFIYENELYFIIGYINISSVLNLAYYKINILANTTELIKNYSPEINGMDSLHGFSCQIMKINDNDKLVCFCTNNFPNEIASFWINIYSDNLEIIDDSLKCLSLNEQGRIIKSVTSPDKFKALIGFSTISSKGYYTIYDINSSSFSDPEYYMDCGYNHYNFLLQYFSSTQEYIFTSFNEIQFKIAKFDKDMNIIQNEYLNSEIEYDLDLVDYFFVIYRYCVSLVPEYENYVFIIDGDFYGSISGRGYLFPNVFKPQKILSNPFISSTNINPSTIIISTIANETIQKSISQSQYTSSQIFTSSQIYTSSPKFSSSQIFTASPKFSSSQIFTSSPIFTSKYNNTQVSTSFNNSLSSFPLISTSMNNLSSTFSLMSPFPSIIQHSSSILTQKNETKYEKETIQCSFEYFYKDIKTNECKKFCSKNEFIKEICYINEINENNIMNITEHFRNLIGEVDLNKNINIIINGNNVVYQLVSSEVIDENIDKNISIIDLGECEKTLKNMFGIDYILILQIDVFLSTSTNIVMKYEIYNPYTLERVNLSNCENMKMNTYLPYSISDEELELYTNLKESGYDLFNPNDSFYLDFCTPYTTYNKTDVLLSDRRTDYYKNKSFCEEGCTYKDFDYVHKKVQCECQINTKNNTDNNIKEVKFFSNAILDSFNDFEKYTNIKTLKCVKLVFSKLGQTKNFGSYIMITFILTYIISLILFCKNGKQQFLTIINTVINQKKKMNAPIKKKKKKKKKIKYVKNYYNNKVIFYKNVIVDKLLRNKTNKKIKVIQNNNSLNKINSFPKTQSKFISSFLPEQSSKCVKNINKNSTLLYMVNKTKNENTNKIDPKYNDIELNNLIYEKALLYDKRSYCQYYRALIKQKHLILFTFVSKIDYNLFTIKLTLFVFTLSLYFALNTLFFFFITIHKIYETHGKYNLIHSIMNIIYSSLISSFLRLILKSLALSNNSILALKNFKNRNKMIRESKTLIEKLYIKLYFYFSISFLFLLFFWYFISSFCAIFNNSQIFFIENSLSSFGLTLIYPFGLYLIPGIFRIQSLKAENKTCMYRFGNLLSFF